MAAHSTVEYIEPNSMHFKWAVNDDFERAPRLEDYCIAMNIEVEVSSRMKTAKDSTKEVLILQYTRDADGKRDKISFMGGTKIGGYNYDGLTRKSKLDPENKRQDIYNALTTYYADMYVGDLVDYGTTEMLGIKSVNIEYQKSCVPIVTVQFTDVRGLSLFQPTELSRDNTFNGIKGLNGTNVAQSFFQCFYKMPIPKFTIYIKGFYGNPVAYEVMCDKFDTNFNSDNGDFDCTARFIGYSYSFMTDVSLDALLVAPYSDYIGKQYWKDNVDNHTFFVWDKTKTTKMPMPTLYEVKTDIERLVRESNEQMEETTLTEEENTHEEEIETLKKLRGLYEDWYEQLFEVVEQKYGKKYCYLFKENGEDGDYYRIIILTNSETVSKVNLSSDYEQYSEDFKNTNQKLYAAIEEYNNSGLKYKTLDNVSLDFSKYTRQKLFNKCYVNRNTRNVEFGGFHRDCRLPKKEVINNVFTSASTEYVLYSIYADGVDQYVDAFVIDVDYSDIKRRVNALQRDANRDVDERTKEKAIKEHNRIMIGKMNWYPTIENFTRIMLAHLETLMAMMYEVSKAAKGRKARDLGVTTGPNGTCSDTNENDEEIPPFPRVTEEIVGEDLITKREDTWVGDLTNGKGFVETDIVNGLFNAVEYIQQLVKQDKQVIEALSNQTNEQQTLLKQPLTPFDFFLGKNPYGSDADVVNNPNAFAAKVAMRMFAVMCLNPFRKQYGSKWSYGDSNFIKTLAKIEADNFHSNVKLTNRRLLEMLSGSNNVAQLSPDAILSLMTANSPINGDIIPWGDRKLFSGDLWLDGYKTKTLTSIYPIEDVSFSKLEESFNYFNSSSNKIDAENKNNIISYIDASSNFMTLFKSSDNTAFNNIFIVDDHNKIKTAIESSTSMDDNEYKPIYELLSNDCLYKGETFAKFIKKNGRTSFKAKIFHSSKSSTKLYSTYNDDSLQYEKNKGEEAKYEIDDAAISQYCNEADNGTIESCTLTEAFGYHKVRNPKTNALSYEIDYDESLFMNDDLDNVHGWLDGVMNYQESQMAFFVMGLDCIDHQATVDCLLSSNNAFNYLPKLAVLQIGVMLATMFKGSSINLMSNITLDSVSSRVMVSRTANIDKLLPYLNRLNPTVKVAYIKYFVNWAKTNYSRVMKFNKKQKSKKGNILNSEFAAFYPTVGNKVRRLFNENSELVRNLTNDLMSIVIVTKGSIYHSIGASETKITKEQAKIYLDAFLERLKEKYSIGYQEDENGNVTRVAETPKKTSKDMKKELYRYLKLLYDKWIPTTEQDEWKYETFFDYDNHDNKKGHLFHFIDSYYNKIGDKLIINPLSLAEKIGAAFDDNNGEVSIMMLGFMADIYAKNKCMLMCLQNFMDLSMKSNMEAMFEPIPFREMPSANKHPDFVVVYPYEPSKNLNVDNAEYNNDGFMLNDEHETPIAIRSRSEGDDGKYYKIPAFGVTYGKQYQSYFKKISVNTQSPIATQQAILAKHAILRAARDSNSKTTVGQDIYDVYTTQSYTCKVEMMGCAWVQPLMYFVLLNVPMFRGSYLIMKVNHKITQGNMVTEFTGVRMANVANKLVEEIFTDETDLFGGSQMYEESQREREGSLDNNCPYKVFPLEEGATTIDITGNEKDVGLSIMRKLIALGYNEYAAAGVVGNMYEESYDVYNTKQRFKYNLTVKDKGVSGGLCMWRNENLIALTQKNPKRYGVDAQRIEPTAANKKAYADKLTSIGLDYQLEFLKKTMSSEAGWSPYKLDKYNKESTSARGAAENFRAKYERGGATEKSKTNRANFADAIYKVYKSSGTQQKTNATDKQLNDKDVRDLFFNALQKSCESTSAVKCGIEKQNIERAVSKTKLLLIKQSDGKSNYLGTIFDIILNGYYDYVQSLWWSYANDLREEPIGIYVEPSLKVVSNKRLVAACKGGQLGQYTVAFNEDTNKALMTALSKKYISMDSKYFTKEVPQLGGNKELLEKFKADDCTSSGGGTVSNGTNATASEVSTNPLSKNSIIKSNDKSKFKDWKVYYAVQHLISHSKSKSIHLCATYVENAIAAGGIPRPACGKENGSAATNLRYLGILERHGFVQIYSGNISPHASPSQPIQAGDISIIGAQGGSKPFHACMYTGRQWISDFRQNNMNVYGSTQPYAIYRYQNNPITTA